MTSLYQQYRVLLNSALCKALVNCLIPERSSAAFLCRVPLIHGFHLILSFPRAVECSGCRMLWQHPVDMRKRQTGFLLKWKHPKPSNVSTLSLNFNRLTHFFLVLIGFTIFYLSSYSIFWCGVLSKCLIIFVFRFK